MTTFYDTKYIEGASYNDGLIELVEHLNDDKYFSVYKKYVEFYNKAKCEDGLGVITNWEINHEYGGDISYDFSVIIKYMGKSPETKEELLKDVNIKLKYNTFTFEIEEEFDDIICTKVDKFRWKICTIFSCFPKPITARDCISYKIVVNKNKSNFTIETVGSETKFVLLQSNIRRKIATSNYRLHIKDKKYCIVGNIICEENYYEKYIMKTYVLEDIYDGIYI